MYEIFKYNYDVDRWILRIQKFNRVQLMDLWWRWHTTCPGTWLQSFDSMSWQKYLRLRQLLPSIYLCRYSRQK